MASSLIPEKPIQVSPSLAATIGLEEATMLSILDELVSHRELLRRDGYYWLHLEQDSLNQHMPFWTDHDIQRISKSLRDKGVIRLNSEPFSASQTLHFAFNEKIVSERVDVKNDEAPSHKQTSGSGPQAHNTITRGANLISPNWQPSDETLGRITQHNIPTSFIQENIPEFITYWRESGEAHRSWGSKFLQHVLHKWRQHETFLGNRDQEGPMPSGWRPSPDAMEVMVKHAGINLQFVEDAIPEFVLYWQERGQPSRTWNSKFIQHVRRQWTRYTSTLEYDTEPKRISENWQPNEDVYDVLRLANIDLPFAKQLVKEFVLFWRDSNQLHTSWNTKFLQHTKFHWAKRHALSTKQGLSNNTQGRNHAGQQALNPQSRTRDHSISEQLADRSWAF